MLFPKLLTSYIVAIPDASYFEIFPEVVNKLPSSNSKRC